MNKRITVLLSGVVLAVFLIVGCNTAKGRTDEDAGSETSVSWIPFTWSDSNKSAIYLPVTIDDIPRKLTMQFDLGANVSLFYGNALAPFLEAYPSLAGKLDRIVDVRTAASWGTDITLNGHEIVKDVSICGKNLKGKAVYYNTSVSSIDDFIVSQGIWGITGNILFLDNIVIIDYKNKTIRIK
ncbi:MAG: hypothetical protein LBD79_06860 [Treponema sp.]|nr:hypothetical protein [Treponema sp.]